MTELTRNGRFSPRRNPRFAVRVVLCCMACVALLAMAGCSPGGQGTGPSTSGSDTSATADLHMAGPAIDVHVTPEVVAARPEPWVLTTPESAVRSYLAWTSYAYRIATSDVATRTMSADETVRVDSYIQYNLENSRLIDQALASIVFGKPAVESTHTLVPTKEQWTYSYLSLDVGNNTLAGPYSASYDSTYTVVKTKNGDWVVDSVAVQAVGTVK